MGYVILSEAKNLKKGACHSESFAALKDKLREESNEKAGMSF